MAPGAPGCDRKLLAGDLAAVAVFPRRSAVVLADLHAARVLQRGVGTGEDPFVGAARAGFRAALVGEEADAFQRHRRLVARGDGDGRRDFGGRHRSGARGERKGRGPRRQQPASERFHVVSPVVGHGDGRAAAKRAAGPRWVYGGGALWMSSTSGAHSSTAMRVDPPEGATRLPRRTEIADARRCAATLPGPCLRHPPRRFRPYSSWGRRGRPPLRNRACSTTRK